MKSETRKTAKQKTRKEEMTKNIVFEETLNLHPE